MSTGAHRTYVTTAIAYVNGEPHLGHALELVQGDVLARHRRLRGDDVRFLTGTDDNALKNVTAAAAAGLPVTDFVARQADRFEALARTLQLRNDDFIRTSTDPRHRPGVERLWRACADAGALAQRDYEGLYCNGCEAFVLPDDLVDELCAEHRTPPERVVERNWFFRLSRYRDALLELIESGRLRIEPAQRRNEVLALVRGGLDDFSVSRPQERAHGWGIPVPGDPSQVIYVWFDALANYVTALGYGTGSDEYARWWCESDERIHVIGKGIVRFHAVYWPAILIAAGEPLPTTIAVHDYVTVDGRKLSKSLGASADPRDVAARHGVDALRWWCVRDAPLGGDTEYRDELLEERATELADGLGNLVGRLIGIAARADGAVPDGSETDEHAPPEAGPLRATSAVLSAVVDAALRRSDLRAAATALAATIDEANRFVSATRPWELARAARAGDGEAAARLRGVLDTARAACGCVAHELQAFLPDAAARVEDALARQEATAARTLFPKVVHTRTGSDTGSTP